MITVTIVSDEITPTLNEIKAKLNDMTEFVLDVGDIWSKQMQYNFSAAAWPPLAVSTIADKMLHGWPLDILVRTDAMRGAATGGAWEGSANRATLDLPGYSAFHLDGTSMMPQRDFTFIQSAMESEIESAFASFLDI